MEICLKTDIARERKLAKRSAIIYTIIYGVLYYPLHIFMLFGMVATHKSLLQYYVDFFSCLWIYFPIPWMCYLMWSRFMLQEYKKMHLYALIPPSCWVLEWFVHAIFNGTLFGYY